MKLNSGLPFSLIRSGLPYNFPKLESSLKTDVAIIGGGITGALMAFHLCEAGIDCVVVDKRTVGLGSTASCTSLLQYELDVSLNDLITFHGESSAIRAYQVCDQAVSKLKQLCKGIKLKDWAPQNSLYYGAHKKDQARLKKEFETRKRIGLDVDFLMRER